MFARTIIDPANVNADLKAFAAQPDFNSLASEVVARVYALIKFVPPVTPQQLYNAVAGIGGDTAPKASDVVKAFKAAGFVKGLDIDTGLALSKTIADVLNPDAAPIKVIPWWVNDPAVDSANAAAAAILPDAPKGKGKGKKAAAAEAEVMAAEQANAEGYEAEDQGDGLVKFTPKSAPMVDPDDASPLDLSDKGKPGFFVRNALKAYIKFVHPAAHAKYKTLKAQAGPAAAYAYLWGLLRAAIDTSIEQNKA